MVRVAEANSLTKGAEASFISLPAASTRIKNLEESIGAKLLNRHSQGVTLTPPGQAFVHRARLVLGQIEHLRGDLQEYASGIKGHLRVYANTTSLSEFLPEVLRRYLATHPDVNIDLQEKLSNEIVRAVIDGKTDIGIVAGSVNTESLQTIAYRSDSLVLVVPQGHAVAELPSLPLRDALATALGDPSLDLANPLKGPFLAEHLDHAAAARTAMELALLAGILPAFLVIWISARVKESPLWLERQRRMSETGAEPALSFTSLFTRAMLPATILSLVLMSGMLFSALVVFTPQLVLTYRQDLYLPRRRAL